MFNKNFFQDFQIDFKNKLIALGLKPISAVVDITNYVMFDLNRPLHAYDADKIDKEIIVRNSKSGETFTALDGKNYKLENNMCVISDKSGVLGLGGVIGGTRSGTEINTKNILFGDSSDGSSDDVLKFGAGSDLSLYHTGTNSYIKNTTNILYLASDQINVLNAAANSAMAKFYNGAQAELYHNNVKTFETASDGITILGAEGGNAFISFEADEGDDNSDKFDIGVYNGGPFKIQNKASGSWEDNVVINGNGSVELYYDNTKRFETTGSGVEVFGELQMDDGNSHIKLIDGARIDIGTGADLRIYHSSTQNFIRGNATESPLYIDCCENVHIRHLDTDGSNAETMIKAIGDGNVELYSNNVKRLSTRSGGNSADGIVVYGNSSNSSVNLFTDTTIRGTLYANSSNLIGFLDNSGQWAFSVAPVGGNTISYNTFLPSSDNGLDLGSSSKRWRNLYTTDLQLSNEGSTNDVDGTWGNYTIQEGESDLFLINNRSGKKYKFNLTEVS